MRLSVENNFENVYIFVADALRYDSIPSTLSDNMDVVKTVASSGITCTSFPTIITGLYPPQHGIWKFSDLLNEEVTTVFDPFSGESPCYMGPHSVLECAEGNTHYDNKNTFEDALRGLEQPFIVLDRELSTHAPYGFDVGNHADESEKIDRNTYFEQRKNDLGRIRDEYNESTRTAVERFEHRIGILEENDQLDNTLVIFTSDHGEQLGEHGMIGHGSPLTPELVYVPTVFYNDDVEVNGNFIGHVDLLPTIFDILGAPVPDGLPGYNLVEGAPDQRKIFSVARHRLFDEWSAWDRDGGHVFTDGTTPKQLAAAAHKLTFDQCAPIYRRRPHTVLSTMLRGERTMGKPSFGREEAREFCQSVWSDTVTSGSVELSNDTKERLRELGYVDSEIE